MSKGKKHDLPSMPFYFGDWRKAPEVRALDLDVRMIWFEMLGYMWESTERGYLTINGNPPTTETLARMLGIDITKLQQALQQMSGFDVYSVRLSDGAIFSRKMVNDVDISEKRSGAGKKGMKSRYKAPISNKTSNVVISNTITNTEYEIENENEVDTSKEKEGLGEKTNSTPDPKSMYNPEVQSKVAQSIYAITDYLNSKTGGNLRNDHHAYCSTIWQRLQDGYTLEQMRSIIDTMVPLWLHEQKTRLWLVPTTLFGDNIDKYLEMTRPVPVREQSNSPVTIFDQP